MKRSAALAALGLLSCLVGAGESRIRILTSPLFSKISNVLRIFFFGVNENKSLDELNNLETCFEDIENLLRSSFVSETFWQNTNVNIW